MTDGYYSLSADVNKVKGKDGGSDTAQGLLNDPLPELTLKMSDIDLLKLTTKWEKRWKESPVRADWVEQCDANKNYWKGKQYSKMEGSAGESRRPLVDNQIFQSIETYLPAATRQNPEPLVELRATEKKTDPNQKFSEIVRDRLADWGDDVKIRLKIKKAGRHWLIFLVGVGKMGWDVTNNRPALKIIRPKKLILDPDGVTDEDGYNGKFIGEYRKMEAGALIEILTGQGVDQKVLDVISDATKGDEEAPNLGSDVQFIEWWTDEYMCWTMDNTVLLKKRNPHWNYDPAQLQKDAEGAATSPSDAVSSGETTGESSDMSPTAETPVTEAQPTESSTPGMSPAMPVAPMAPDMPQEGTPTPPVLGPINKNNHFPAPRKPYVFISIFNLGETPVDETSLITQNLPQQDLINKRLRQTDKNIDGMNGGVVVSEERSGLTKDEAKGVTDALRRGGTVIIPTGSAQDAVYRLPSVPLPSDVYNQLLDTRNRMYDLFGIRGITPAGIKNEDTVRGKIITKGLDTDRIGGGVTEYFEQFADEVFNWAYQLYLVYDEIFQDNATSVLPKIKISVKEGSLLPKDATTKANQAIELAAGGKMALIDLYKALEYPDPEKMAANVWLEINAPETLFPDDPRVQQVMQARQQAAQGGGAKPPSESINFKDLPPEGKAQMAKQAGIELSPESAAAHEASQKPQPAQGRDVINSVPIAPKSNE